MDNKKIGELIAKLRKEKGLTQQDLGDKVGVGSRAVSKWECGLTIPDISIINELSEILGISSDELLKGKLKKTHAPNKLKLKNIHKLIIITLIIITLLSSSLLLIYKGNKTYSYIIAAEDHKHFQVDGYLTYKNQELTININEFSFQDSELTNKKLIEYQYYIKLGDREIYSYGQAQSDLIAQTKNTLLDIKDSLKRIHQSRVNLSKQDISKEQLSILLTAIDQENKEYFYDIKILLYEKEK